MVIIYIWIQKTVIEEAFGYPKLGEHGRQGESRWPRTAEGMQRDFFQAELPGEGSLGQCLQGTGPSALVPALSHAQRSPLPPLAASAPPKLCDAFFSAISKLHIVQLFCHLL